MITKGNALIFVQNLSTYSLRKCMEISLGNLYVDIGAWRDNIFNGWPHILCKDLSWFNLEKRPPGEAVIYSQAFLVLVTFYDQTSVRSTSYILSNGWPANTSWWISTHQMAPLLYRQGEAASRLSNGLPTMEVMSSMQAIQNGTLQRISELDDFTPKAVIKRQGQDFPWLLWTWPLATFIGK